jgi:hypothetical protein
VAIRTTALGKTIGYPVSLDPEWSMLWAALQPHYPDSATFIPTIARVLVAWCDVFTAWLEAKENEDGVERLLEEMNSVVKVVIEVSSAAALLLPFLDASLDVRTMIRGGNESESFIPVTDEVRYRQQAQDLPRPGLQINASS